MSRKILILEDAVLDLDEHFNYLAQQDQDAALRFFDAARQTFAALAKMPGMGKPYDSEADLSGLHQWFVKGFRKHLIFYRFDLEAIEIVRVIYATRDLEPLLKNC